MRILHIIAGTANMYCGACMRDINLVRALIRRGHDLQVAPLYTPLRVEGEGALPTTRVFFGGVNVFLQHASEWFSRSAPRWLDRLLDHPGLLSFAARFALQTQSRDVAALTVSVLAGREGRIRRETDKFLDFLAAGERFDVIAIVSPLLAALAPVLKERFDVPVVIALQGEDLFVDAMPEPYRSEARDWMRRHCASADAFVAPGQWYADLMGDYLGLPADSIHVAASGIDPAEYPVSAHVTSPFTVAYLSVINPGKGLDQLVEAFAIVRKSIPDARLLVAGKVLDPPYWRTIVRRMRALGLTGAVTVRDEVDLEGKLDVFANATVFALPSPAPPTRGMIALEAMSTGLPVVLPDHGAFAEIVAATGGGLLHPPGDVVALAAGLLSLARDADARAAMGAAGAAGVRARYTSDLTAAAVERAYLAAVGRHSSRRP